jgi:predicted DNA-binding transcriptional regulator YafY
MPVTSNDVYSRRLPESTRIARVLEIIWRISIRPRYWTRSRLAEEFEVSERTITADLDILRHRLRFELLNDRGRGYYFERVPQLPSVSYSVPEALALILAAEAGRHVSGISQQDLSSAIARLESVFPGELGRMVRHHADRGAAPGPTHRERMLQVCAQAALSRQRLHIEYITAYRGGAETSRDVDPWAVFPYDRSWHMVGYCHLRNDVRVFKIDRVRAATMLEQRFQPPRDFDLAAFLSDGWGLMRGIDAPVERVVLRFSPVAAAWIIDEQWHASQEMRTEDDGWLTFQVQIQITPEFQRWVFGYGREVRVIAPDSLRRWVEDEARAVLSTNA